MSLKQKVIGCQAGKRPSTLLIMNNKLENTGKYEILGLILGTNP